MPRRGGRRHGLGSNPASGLGRPSRPPATPPDTSATTPSGRRVLGLGPEQPTPPPRPARRALGHGPTPPEPRPDVRRDELTGVTPYNRYEATLFANVISPNRPSRYIDTQPTYSPGEIQEYVDEASRKLGQEKTEALRRAFGGDDSTLLTTWPTNTSNPQRPRTLGAGYDAKSQTLFVRFRGARWGPQSFADGVGYEYYNVTRAEWRDFRDNWSPGRRINAVFNNKPYTPAGW